MATDADAAAGAAAAEALAGGGGGVEEGGGAAEVGAPLGGGGGSGDDAEAEAEEPSPHVQRHLDQLDRELAQFVEEVCVWAWGWVWQGGRPRELGETGAHPTHTLSLSGRPQRARAGEAAAVAGARAARLHRG